MRQDRFEKMVNKVVHASFADDEMLLTKNEAVRLLRREHRRVVRIVKQSNPDRKAWPAFQRGYHLAKKDLLAALKRDAKASK